MTRADPTAKLPPARVEPDTRRRIRRALADAGRRIAVLDDDPTGSQTVHGVDVVTVVEPEELAAGLAEAGSTCFILTNTRSLAEADAVALNTRIGRMLLELADRLEVPIEVVSRSDSTLRGHVIAEVRALDAVRREATGRGFDGVLLAPAYFEAGRFTAGDVHWARVGTDVLPVGETEFARDPPSAMRPLTCATSSPRRVAGRSGRVRSCASPWTTSAWAGRRGWLRSSAG
jgi:uncharacterized protein YgbK (DUF1537 family)